MSSSAAEYDSVHRALTLFGLTSREAAVYLELLTRGDAAAGELAKRLGLHRLDVYYDLKSLQRREMVESTLSRPMRYRPTPLDEVVKSIERVDRDETRRRAIGLTRLRTASQKLDHPRPPPRDWWQNNRTTDTIRIIGGRKAIRAKWLDLLNAARNEILIVATEKGPAQSIFLSAVDTVVRKMRKGVNVRVFTPVVARDQRIRRVSSKVRHLAASAPAGLCVVDRDTAMIITGPTGTGKTSSGQETALLTSSKSIGEMLRTLFFVGWNTSPTFEERVRKTSLQPAD